MSNEIQKYERKVTYYYTHAFCWMYNSIFLLLPLVNREEWITSYGSELEDILNEFIEIKNEEERVKREFSSRKKTVLKKLKNAMRDI